MRIYLATVALALFGGCAAFYPAFQHNDATFERCRAWRPTDCTF